MNKIYDIYLERSVGDGKNNNWRYVLLSDTGRLIGDYDTLEDLVSLTNKYNSPGEVIIFSPKTGDQIIYTVGEYVYQRKKIDSSDLEKLASLLSRLDGEKQ